MRTRNKKRQPSIQILEDRRLLAADFAAELLPPDFVPGMTCDVAEVSTMEVAQDQIDLDATELPVASADPSAESSLDPAVEASADPGEDSPIDEASVDEANIDSGTEEASAVSLGDPVDGTDGYFGELADGESQTFSLTPSQDGIAEVVVASSFGGAETHLTITDADGNLVTESITENLDGFQQLSFEVTADTTYELTVGTEDGASGRFQVTSGHSDFPEPVDLHADEIGSDSTELTFTESTSEISGELEEAGDIDTFRFVAPADGEIRLDLAELVADNATELQVRVQDAQGQQLTRGITNEEVGISFDVVQDGEYFLEISAAEGQTGFYGLALTLDATETETETPTPGPEAPIVEVIDDVDGDGTEDVVADDNTSDVSDGGLIDDIAGDEGLIDDIAGDEGLVDRILEEEITGDAIVSEEVTEEDAIAGDADPLIESDFQEEVVGVTDQETEICVIDVVSDGESVGEQDVVIVDDITPVDDVTTTPEDQSAAEIVDVDDIAVDQPIDLPESFEADLELPADRNPADETEIDLAESVDDLPVDPAVTPVDEIVDERADESLRACFGGENEAVDSIFEELDSFDIDSGELFGFAFDKLRRGIIAGASHA